MAFIDHFRPKWQHSDSSLRLAAVERVVDQAILRTVATNDNDRNVREAAVKKVTAPAVLVHIATTDSDENIREAAVDNLTDQALLYRLALNAPDNNVRLVAAAKLHDASVAQDVFERVALNDKNWIVRRKAVQLLSNQKVLARIATDRQEHDDTRYSAAAKLADKSLAEVVYAHIAVTSADDRVRDLATSQLYDQSPAHLYALALTYPNAEVRQAIVSRITDQTVLARIALNDEHRGVAAAATRNLTDWAVLVSLAHGSKVSDIAQERLASLPTDSDDVTRYLAEHESEPVQSVSLVDAVKRGTAKVVSATGSGLYNVTMTLQFSDRCLHIPLSMTLTPSTNCQTMSVRKTVHVERAGDVTEREIDVPVVCADYHKPVPGVEDSFVSFGSADSLVRAALLIAEYFGASEFVTQLVVWNITDNIDFEKVCLTSIKGTAFDRVLGTAKREERRPTGAEKKLAAKIVSVAREVERPPCL